MRGAALFRQVKLRQRDYDRALIKKLERKGRVKTSESLEGFLS